MAHVGPCRLCVAVGCAACGTVVHVHLTVTPLPAPADELRMRVVTDADDRVMLELFSEAHRGPLVRVS